MAHNFKSIRLIPSLNGNLYKFDGEDIEQLPITADDLLRSSFQFPDELVANLVISGKISNPDELVTNLVISGKNLKIEYIHLTIII